MVRLRDLTPKGFYARTVLIMIVPILVLMVGMTWYYFEGHLKQVNTRLSDAIGRDIALITMSARQDPGFVDTASDLVSQTQAYSITVAAGCPVQDARSEVRRTYPTFADALDDNLEEAFSLAFSGPERDLTVCTETATDTLIFTVPRKRAVILNGHIFIVWVVGVGLLLTLTAWLFLRNQVRSILRLREAALAFGRGRDDPGFRPSGATEVREAARAVIDMRTRLRAASEQRTAMLAAVSHDLRTPLTRLKLQLAMVDQSDDIQAAREDLNDMAAMLDEYLAFARGEEGEAATQVRVDELVADVADATGVEVKGLEPLTLNIRPLAIKRALTNLVSNAIAHGTAVEMTFVIGPRALDLLIDDDGPGIPEMQREDALKPFARLDEARNQNAPGVGLGLALALDVARSHGGNLRLEDSPLGGLRAVFRLPL